MPELKKRLKIAVAQNETTIRCLANEWGVRETLVHRVAAGATTSKRIKEKIIQYIGDDK